MEKVVWIVGASFSGSSLLNLLLDTQPTIRGLGEGSQVYWRGPGRNLDLAELAGGPCATCKSTVKECRLFGGYRGEPFYRFNSDYYKCNVLVDSSKSVEMFQYKPMEVEYQYFVILLSKAPHEAAYSWMLHAKWDYWDSSGQQLKHVAAGIDFYIWTYRKYLRELDCLSIRAPIVCIQYQPLVANPVRSVERLCTILGEPFEPNRLLGNWWETDTHVLGGNPAVVAQIARDDQFAFAIPPDRYLDGKYANQVGKIFYDDAWRRDFTFIEAFLEAMLRRESELRVILPRLGHQFDAIVGELNDSQKAVRESRS